MGVGETFHWALGDGELLGSAVSWESLSQTHETGPHPASSPSLCPSLAFCLILCLSFILAAPLSDYLLFLLWCLFLSFPLIHPTAASALICSGLLVTQHFRMTRQVWKVKLKTVTAQRFVQSGRIHADVWVKLCLSKANTNNPWPCWNKISCKSCKKSCMV